MWDRKAPRLGLFAAQFRLAAFALGTLPAARFFSKIPLDWRAHICHRSRLHPHRYADYFACNPLNHEVPTFTSRLQLRQRDVPIYCFRQKSSSFGFLSRSKPIISRNFDNSDRQSRHESRVTLGLGARNAGGLRHLMVDQCM